MIENLNPYLIELFNKNVTIKIYLFLNKKSSIVIFKLFLKT